MWQSFEIVDRVYGGRSVSWLDWELFLELLGMVGRVVSFGRSLEIRITNNERNISGKM